jgi:hypothetical protein
MYGTVHVREAAVQCTATAVHVRLFGLTLLGHVVASFVQNFVIFSVILILKYCAQLNNILIVNEARDSLSLHCILLFLAEVLHIAVF